MKRYASVSALAAAALASSVAAAAPAAASHLQPAPVAASHAQAAPAARSPLQAAHAAVTSIQPGGPLGLARGSHASRQSITESTQNVVSNNWGGYVALKSGTHFRYIQSTFFVPYVDCASTPDSFSGHWVGIDGANNASVEQDGILAACQGTTPAYAAWYEMFPQPPVYPDITIRPGDSILASVYYNSSTRKFTLKLADTTNGRHFSVTRSCPSGASCQRTSAEAISEAPSSGTGVLPLTDFRAEGYSDTKVTNRSGQHGGLRSPNWNTLAVTTVNSSGTVLDQPTAIFRGTAFSMYWMAES
jgi:peptidase A4-like protein